jgi:hypothetical protein
VLMDSNICQIIKEIEYWVSMAQVPQKKIQKRWVKYEISWEKINQEMKDIVLPKFDIPEDFVDLHDIVKRHAKNDLVWEVEITQVEIMTLGQVNMFMEHPIKAHAVLQCLSAKIIRYREWEIEIKETLSTPMDQHRFPYANTCVDLFFKWSEYENNHPL